MPDLQDILVGEGVIVPEQALTMRAVRAGGPGGQNVNKLATKVELHVDLGQVIGLDDAGRCRLRLLPGVRFDAGGRLLVTSARFRTQDGNLRQARQKVRELLAQALSPPRPRRPTRPSRAGVERRLREKQRRATIKAQRCDRGGSDHG